MKLSALIAPLIAAKVPHEQIMAVVVAFEEQQADALDRRRATDAARQAKHRKSRDVTLRHSDRSLATRAEDEPLTSAQEQKESSLRSDRAPKRAVRLADDWLLPNEWRQDALDEGLPEIIIDREAAKMRDWSRSSKNGAKLDWRASWRNWCRSAAERLAPRPPPSARPPTLADAFGQIAKTQRDSHGETIDPRAAADNVLHLPLPSQQR